MDYDVCVIKKEPLHSARKVTRGEISILAECADAGTAKYICSLFAEKGIDAFVASFKDCQDLQSKFLMKRDSITNLNIMVQQDEETRPCNGKSAGES